MKEKIYFWTILGTMLFLVFNVPSVHAQGGTYIGWSQEMKWLRVSSLHAYFSEHGSEPETGGDNEWNNRFSWPAEYGLVQSTIRARGMWLGCKDFFDPKVQKQFAYMVTNIGPKPGEYPQRPIPDAIEFKMVGRFEHPIVTVDGASATHNTMYDEVDEIDESLPADRMILIKNHTPIGVTVTKKVYAFTRQDHGNYFIYDYVIKNTGILDNEGTTYQQPIKGFYILFSERYALAGESIENADPRWGAGDAAYGRNVIYDVVGTDPTKPEFNDPNSPLYHLRAHFAYYGPHSGRPVPLEDDWGCPNQLGDGVMAAAKFVGHMTIHADKGPHDQTDDLYQPRTTHYVNSDEDIMQRATSPYNEPLMAKRYAFMAKGHAERTHAEEIALSGLSADKWGPGVGGTTIVQAFGPYDLEPGDSIHIVLAGGVAGLSREKNREVGGNWLQYYKGTGTPTLIMPDGSITTDHTAYKKAWVWTCKDSLFKTYRLARENYESGFRLAQPPPPPEWFMVESGGDRIRLTWADNPTEHPHFGGYVIYRSEGNVLEPKTVYKKVFECDKENVVHLFDDTTAVRGFDYYYYIQSKDDGQQEPGKVLYSSMFWTVTSKPARLLRPAGHSLTEVRVVPNPYDIRARAIQFGEFYQYDRIAFYGLPPFCKVRIYTERGDLIWEKDHTNGAGDEVWDSMTKYGQIVASGVYILYVEVTEDTYDTWIKKDRSLLYRKGDSVYRKFVVIR